MSEPATSYRLEIRPLHDGAAEAAVSFLRSRNATPDGTSDTWRLEGFTVTVNSGSDITIDIPLDVADPPVEPAADFALDLSRHLGWPLNDLQLDREVSAEDMPELVEQFAAGWEPPDEPPTATGRAVSAFLEQSTASMVALFALSAIAAGALVIYLEIPERYLGSALFAGLLGFAVLLFSLRSLLRRVSQAPGRREGS